MLSSDAKCYGSLVRKSEKRVSSYRGLNYSKYMRQIQGKSGLLRVSKEFGLLRVLVIGVQMYNLLLFIKGIFKPELREEMYCHLCNQTWGNTSDTSNERGWLLFALFLCCFAPSTRLYKPLLK